MNAVMRIQVRVLNGATPEIKAIQAALMQMAKATQQATAMMQKQSAASAAAMGKLTTQTTRATVAQRGFANAVRLSNLEKYGKNLQWTGRQIEYNFTLPLLLAGAAATKWALDQEREFTRVRKVYGDQAEAVKYWQRTGLSADQALTKSKQVFNEELDALNRNFLALSNTFGVNRAEVNKIAADWAAAGASGVDLAKSTRLTMEAMILGEMDASQATESLIAIQAQYGASTEDLIKILGTLNATENATGTTMNDLIQGFSRSAGAARTAGVDYRHLAAMIAALTPATGSATNSGNALRTILSRILAPTKDAADLMRELGLHIDGAGWASKNGTQRLIALAKAMDGATQQQKAVVSAYVASRYQVNRFDVLMRELLQTNGYYAKSLHATSNEAKIAAQYQSELSAVLKSSPKQFDILKERMRNLMTEAIIPFIPAILAVMDGIVKLASKWESLDPRLQKLIVASLAFIAVFGTLTRVAGATILLFTRLGAAVAFVGRMIWGLVSLKWLTTLLADLGLVGFSGFFKNAAGETRKGWLMIAGLFKWGGGLLATSLKWTAGALAVMWGLIIRGMVALPAAARLTVGATAAAWRALPMIIATISVNVRAALFVMGAAMAALPGMARTAVAAVAVAWRTLPLLLGAVGAATRVAVAALAATFAALPAAMSAAVATTGMIIRTLPLLIAAVSGPTKAAMVAIVGIVRGGMLAVSAALLAPTKIMGAIRMMWVGIVAIFGGGMKALLGLMARLVPILLGPWGIVFAAAATVVYTFRDNIFNALRSVVNGFGSLPTAIASAFRAVISVIVRAIEIIRDLLSYLNPFQRHSPSLVDNVKAGVAVIAKEYASLRGIGTTYRAAAKDLAAFTRATAAARAASDRAKEADTRKTIRKFSGAPGIAAYDKLKASMDRLAGAMAKVAKEYNKQAAVVARWEARLDAANDALDKQQAKLDRLTKVANDYGDALAEAQSRLQDYMDAPLKGEKAMNQAILDNSIAQAKLRLEMMGIEDAVGPIDDVRNRLAMMQGEIESLRGDQLDLRRAGAGSEILGVYDDQIKAIQQQQNAVTDQVRQYDELSNALDELDRKAQRLDLEKYLNFDAVHDQINLLVDTTQELTSDQILAGIARESAEVERLQAAYDAAAAAVEKQQAVVDAATAARDALQARYDKERKALEALGTAYDAMEARYRSMEQALNDFASIAEDALRKAKAAADAAKGAKGGGGSPALDAFKNAGKGDFADAGLGGGLPIRSDWSSQAADIDALTKQIMDDAQKSFGSLDMFGPLKDMWKQAVTWLKDHIPAGVQEFVMSMKDNLKSVIGTAGIGAAVGLWIGGPVGAAVGAVIGAVLGNLLPKDFYQKIGATLKAAGEKIAGWISTAWGKVKKVAGAVWSFIGPELTRFGKLVWDFLKGLGGAIWEGIGGLADLWPLVKGAFGNVIGFIKNVLWPIFKVVMLPLLAAWKIAWPIIINVLKPIFDGIIGIIKNAFQIVKGIFQVVLGILSGDWGAAWDGIKNIVSGTFGAIWTIIKTAGGVIWGVVKGIVEGIVNFFTWLWDVLVGHSIIPDTVNAIISWFQFMLTPLKAVWDAIVWVIQNVVAPVFTFLWNTVKTVATWIGNAISFMWDNVVKPVWNALKWYFTNVLGPIFKWLWENIVKPVMGWIGDKVKSAWENVIKPAWNALKQGAQWVGEKVLWLWNNAIKPAWDNIKQGIKFAWENVIRPAWNAMKDASMAVGRKVLDLWQNFIKPAWDNIKDKIAWAWDRIKDIWDRLKGSVGSIGDAFGRMKDRVVGIWDGIKSKISGVVDWISTKVGWILDKINSVKDAAGSIFSGGFDFNFGFAKGGQLPESRVGSGFVTNKARAIVGEGSNQWAEYVVPTDPRYRKRAMALWAALSRDLGLTGVLGAAVSDVMRQRRSEGGVPMLAAGGVLQARARASYAEKRNAPVEYAPAQETRELHFHGDLSFPNVRDGSDAEEFIKNLEGLAG